MYANKKKNNFSKVVVLLLCLSLLIGGVIGGTIAYLMDSSEEVVNTFVAGDIGNLELKETKGDNFKVIPGVNINKDPVLTFSGFNVPAFVFVKVEASAGWTPVATNDNKTHTYSIGVEGAKMTWVLDDWTALAGNPGVYYKEVAADAGDQTWNLIQGDTITVSEKITAEQIEKYASNLKFSAYAIQKQKTAGSNFDPVEAWGKFA